jgi:hypothetical protein
MNWDCSGFGLGCGHNLDQNLNDRLIKIVDRRHRLRINRRDGLIWLSRLLIDLIALISHPIYSSPLLTAIASIAANIAANIAASVLSLGHNTPKTWETINTPPGLLTRLGTKLLLAQSLEFLNE